MKTQQQRIRDAAEVVEKFRPVNVSSLAIARAILEAADAPAPPEWPTDASVIAHRKACKYGSNVPGSVSFETSRRGLKEAFQADPVIRSAIAWYDDKYPSILDSKSPAGDLAHALLAAGLVKDNRGFIPPSSSRRPSLFTGDFAPYR